MNITVTGCKDEALEQELIKATRFFAKELLSRKMMPHIGIDIVLKTRLPDLGSCMVTYYNDWYKPREFEIELRKHRSLKNTLITLAHEMVHLKQFAKGELNCEQTRWKGVKFDSDAIDYHSYPWEIEASSMERLLYHAYEENI